MNQLRCYDIFLTHAWRFHDDWVKFSSLIDNEPGVRWRNFSLPWHDPAVSANTESGGLFIRDFLERQIIPAHVVVLLSGVHGIASARRWFDLEVELAVKHRKPIIAVPAFGEHEVPDEVVSLSHAVCGWDVRQLLETVDNLMARPAYSAQEMAMNEAGGRDHE